MEAYLKTLEKGEKIPEKTVKSICEKVRHFLNLGTWAANRASLA